MTWAIHRTDGQVPCDPETMPIPPDILERLAEVIRAGREHDEARVELEEIVADVAQGIALAARKACVSASVPLGRYRDQDWYLRAIHTGSGTSGEVRVQARTEEGWATWKESMFRLYPRQDKPRLPAPLLLEVGHQVDALLNELDRYVEDARGLVDDSIKAAKKTQDRIK